MSTRGHNKKRNAGLLYEFLVRTISQGLVDGDTKRSNAALRLVRKHFKPGSELHREFRLINSLIKTTVSSEAVAMSILQEAKAAARGRDLAVLDREKSLLISSINHALNDVDFYDQQVNEYKMFATVQTLLNDWRSADIDLGRVAQYEDQLVKWLVTDKVDAPTGDVPDASPGTGRLLMKVMMRKLNEKYDGMLTGDQKQLLRAYAFSTANDDPASIKLKLQEVKQRLLQEIDAFRETVDSVHLSDKLVEARRQLDAEALDTINDDTVTRFMLYAKLSSELGMKD